MKTKAEILNTIKYYGFPAKEVAISFTDFFNNDNCKDAIGVNIEPEPPLAEKFHQVFKNLLDLGKADSILVRIADIDDPEDWFYSDTVYVIGNVTLEDLKAQIKELSPDEIYEEWMYGKPVNVDGLQNGQKIYSIWWD